MRQSWCEFIQTVKLGVYDALFEHVDAEGLPCSKCA